MSLVEKVGARHPAPRRCEGLERVIQISPITAGVTAWLAGCPTHQKRSPSLTMIPVNGAR